ncbi:MAG TPA: hypothetical protein VLM38_18300 [Blastocatellia bacterium]|nr:hypothetical protein [Blastocatellia bacterium]
MYCPICGAESTQGLNYCKRCGAGLSASTAPFEAPTASGKTLGVMTFLLSVVSIAGFIALFATVFNLGERQAFDPRALIAIMAFGGATVFGVVGLFVWLLLRVSSSNRPQVQPKAERPVIREYIPSQLPPSPVSMPSVTENTTRNFDPAYRDKSVRE